MSYLNHSYSHAVNLTRIIPPTHISLTPLKNSIKFPKLDNFSTIQSRSTSILAKIKQRHKKPEMNVDPVLAATVVKNYILPMFEKKSILANNGNRSQIMGLSTSDMLGSRDSTPETTVYEELKLSEKLLMELEALNSKVAKAEQSAAISEQQRYEFMAEIQNLQAEKREIALNLEICKLEFNHQTKNSHANEMKLYFVFKQLERYQKLYKVSEEKLGEISNELYEAKHINDIRL